MDGGWEDGEVGVWSPEDAKCVTIQVQVLFYYCKKNVESETDLGEIPVRPFIMIALRAAFFGKQYHLLRSGCSQGVNANGATSNLSWGHLTSVVSCCICSCAAGAVGSLPGLVEVV